MRDRQVLDGAGGGLGHHCGNAGRAVFRDHEPVGAQALARAGDGAEVARVRDAVERDHERVGSRQQLLGVRVRIRIAERDHTLMVGALGQNCDTIEHSQ